MLNETSKWRRWLGLRGNLWYYGDPPRWKKKLSKPSLWTAVVAALSTLLTATFAYQNLRLSRENFVLANPPKVVISDFLITPPWRANRHTSAWDITALVSNVGAGKAKNVEVWVDEPEIQSGNESINYFPLKYEHQRSSTLALHTQASFKELRTSGPRIDQNSPATVWLFISFSNEFGERQPEARHCYFYREDRIRQTESIEGCDDPTFLSNRHPTGAAPQTPEN